MDRVDVAFIAGGITVMILSLLFYNHAFGDYLDLREDIIWTKNPVVCAGTSLQTADLYELGFNHNKIAKSILTWKWKLQSYTLTKDYNYTLKWLESKSGVKSGCDIFIDLGITKDAYGLTKCLHFTDGMKCAITIDRGVPSNYFLGTITHEMGHALGLGHRLSYTKCDFAAVVLSFDIMMQQAGKHQKITDEDLKALIAQYGKNGFYEPNNYESYYPISEKPLRCA